MPETVEERARRLGLIPPEETVAHRAARLGLSSNPDRPFVDAPEIVNKRTADNAPLTALTQHNGKPFVNAKEDQPDIGDKVLGVVAATGREIPFAERAQAGIRSLVRGGSYRDALNDIRTAEDAAPAVATGAARIGGGALSALTIGRLTGAGPVFAAGQHGVLTGLGAADEMSLKDRIDQAGARGAIEAGTAGLVKGATSAPVRNAIGGTVDVARALTGSRSAQARVAGRVIGAIRGAGGAAGGAPEASAADELAGPIRLGDLRPRRLGNPGVEGLTHSGPASIGEVGGSVAKRAVGYLDVAEPTVEGLTHSGPASVGESIGDPVTSKLQNLLELSAKTRPAGEVPATWGDAEEAMGLAPHQQPDLEDLLRRSLTLAKKAPTSGTPRVP